MGLGVVLLFWLVLSGVIAVVGAVVLAGLVYVVERRRQVVRKRWLVGAIVLPFASLAYIGGVFIVYAIWSVTVRGVDFGMGDTWQVPLARGYSLNFIDTFEQSFVMSPEDRSMHHDLKLVGSSQDYIAGEDAEGFFLIDARRRTESRVRSGEELRLRLSGSGQSIELVPPSDYYVRHRWGLSDAVALIGMVVPPILLLFVFGWRFVRAQRRPEATWAVS